MRLVQVLSDALHFWADPGVHELYNIYADQHLQDAKSSAFPSNYIAAEGRTIPRWRGKAHWTAYHSISCNQKEAADAYDDFVLYVLRVVSTEHLFIVSTRSRSRKSCECQY